MKEIYSPDFYRAYVSQSRQSSDAVAPLVTRLINPRSVVDIGCGTGTWLAAFRRYGVADILGVDGGAARTEQLQIEPQRFLRRDLERPLQLGRTFDLAVSLEVAEHLDGRYADAFVEMLTGLAPVVLFSAAIPEQDGVGHVNMQWPEYWVTRFRQRGYVMVDALRPMIWHDERVAWVYRQNCLFFVREDRVGDYPALLEQQRAGDLRGLPLVHPEHYRTVLDARVSRYSITDLLAAVPAAAIAALDRLVGRLTGRLRALSRRRGRRVARPDATA